MLPRDLRALAADAAAAAAAALLDAPAILAAAGGETPSGDRVKLGGLSLQGKGGALRVEQGHLDTALAALKRRTATDVRAVSPEARMPHQMLYSNHVVTTGSAVQLELVHIRGFDNEFK